MAVIQDFSVTPAGTASVSSPRFTVAARVYDNGGALLADLTGASALSFPAVLKTITADQQAELAQLVAEYLVRAKAGV